MARMPPSFVSTSSSVNFFRCGIEKLTPGYVRHAFVAVLAKLPPVERVPFCALLLSSSLRFLVAGSAGGCEGWFRMYVEMSRKRPLCVGYWSFTLMSDLSADNFLFGTYLWQHARAFAVHGCQQKQRQSPGDVVLVLALVQGPAQALVLILALQVQQAEHSVV